MGKLIIDGNSVYELDEACIREKEERKKKVLQEKSDTEKKQTNPR